jgi:hypothetical protein
MVVFIYDRGLKIKGSRFTFALHVMMNCIISIGIYLGLSTYLVSL